MIPIDGRTFRSAVRANRLGEEDSERVYKGRVQPISEASLDRFMKAIESRIEEPYSGVTVASNEQSQAFTKLLLISEMQAAQEDFSEQEPETVISEELHSFVEHATGNVFLPLLDGTGPNQIYGPRCNIHDEQSYDHALSQKGMMLPFKGSARILLELGVSVDAENSWGETCLMYACSLLNTKMIKWLLEHGANPNHETKGSKATPLHRLVEAQGSDDDKSQLVTLLVEQKANVNAENFWGTTPLHLASALLLPKTILVLLNAGASPAAVDSEDRAPQDMLLEAGNQSEHAKALEAQVSSLVFT